MSLKKLFEEAKAKRAVKEAAGGVSVEDMYHLLFDYQEAVEEYEINGPGILKKLGLSKKGDLKTVALLIGDPLEDGMSSATFIKKIENGMGKGFKHAYSENLDGFKPLILTKEPILGTPMKQKTAAELAKVWDEERY
jgi:hypothetical protein